MGALQASLEDSLNEDLLQQADDRGILVMTPNTCVTASNFWITAAIGM
ncbi:MAG: hypothetical protein UY09_C0005G0016 [Parcubacteria group bacterium GW2011_GWA2_47_8]|nr:MAG: hypothetical protein UY09_C0005G0016 [Parcubacteria group bacterium GW2011_GWA2_47_8]